MKKVIGVAIAISLLVCISWLCTCGIIKLITLCFGWKFKWAIATGIWLVMILLGNIFKSNSK